jgi:7,8-dihydro-6-hydroxymethylpterin dimethyltransferase
MIDARPVPPERKFTDHVYYSMTKSLCGTCKAPLDAKIVFAEDAVWFDKFCPTHGHQRCRVSSSVEWYLDALSFVAPATPPKRISKPVTDGCPFDCGACPSHQQKVYLPVVPIISACNLDCPICYTINKNEAAHQMSTDDLSRILGHLAEDHDELDIINFTGGEPTLHPELPAFLEMCRAAGVRRVTISTNGLRLRDEAYVRRLAALDARIVLSLDTFRPETDRLLLGANTVKAKLDALALLEKHDVATTILPAVAMGLNDDEVGSLLALVLSKPHMRSLELHTMTFTGQGGVGFQRSARITIPDLHDRITTATEGRIGWRDFVPSPLAHPHCYSICYVLSLDGGGYVPFARLTSRATMFQLLGDSLYIEPREQLEQVFRDLIDDLWANPDRVPESAAVLKTVKRLLNDMFPSDRQLSILERQKISERAVKAIYIHSHMDEENFDVARVMKCPVGVPQEDGGNIPTCSYNVLYREKDARFADSKMLHRMTVTRPAPAKETA